MNTIYLETSALLVWLLGEPAGEKVRRILDATKNVLTSSLTLLEARRALIRLESRGELRAAERQRLQGVLTQAVQGFSLMEITDEVQKRASDKFPIEPVRSLDAIHLATVLEFLNVYSDVQVATFDERVVQNLEPLGLQKVAFE